jgi:hypothetical protein
VQFQAAVEGDLDEAVLRRLMKHVGAELGTVYGREGKQRLRANLDGYNSAAQRFPWVILVDLDNDTECAPEFCRVWLPQPAALMSFRVVVRQVEAWLLGDRDRAAQFLSVSPALLPTDPETVPNAKDALIRLAERSRRRDIRESLPPASGSRRSVGVLYNPLLRRFVADEWRPDVAADRCDSLKRCLARLAEMHTP